MGDPLSFEETKKAFAQGEQRPFLKLKAVAQDQAFFH